MNIMPNKTEMMTLLHNDNTVIVTMATNNGTGVNFDQ